MSKSAYRDLEVWQKARVLAAQVYRLTAAFPKHELFGLTSQMRRAAVAVACNIAEAQGRRATGDRIQFLAVARGSLFELEAQAIIASDLEFVEPAAAEQIGIDTGEVTRLLNGLMRHYQQRQR